MIREDAYVDDLEVTATIAYHTTHTNNFITILHRYGMPTVQEPNLGRFR